VANAAQGKDAFALFSLRFMMGQSESIQSTVSWTQLAIPAVPAVSGMIHLKGKWQGLNYTGYEYLYIFAPTTGRKGSISY